MIANLQIQKKNSKFPSEKKKKKHRFLLSTHEVGITLFLSIYLCCRSKHVCSKPKCHDLHNVQLFLYLSKELKEKKASEIFSRLELW